MLELILIEEGWLHCARTAAFIVVVNVVDRFAAARVGRRAHRIGHIGRPRPLPNVVVCEPSGKPAVIPSCQLFVDGRQCRPDSAPRGKTGCRPAIGTKTYRLRAGLGDRFGDARPLAPSSSPRVFVVEIGVLSDQSIGRCERVGRGGQPRERLGPTTNFSPWT